MEIPIFNSKNPFVATVAICSVVSALVGGVFGFYGATLAGKGDTFVSNITHPGYADESSDVSNIVHDYAPAVVSIVAYKDVPIMQEQDISPFQDFCDDPYFSQFFDCDLRVPQYTQNGTKNQEVAAGTGFVVRSDGLIVTNKHVVNVTGATYKVVLNDGTTYAAKVLARDPVQDIAFVKIEAKDLQTMKLGDSDQLQVGQTVVAIGNALGQFSDTVSKGIISGLARSVTASEGTSSEQLDQLIQTDAAINPGNSGGPLMNLQGEVVGVDTAMASGAQNIGFALPINRIKRDMQDLDANGKIVYPYLGVQYEIVNSDIQSSQKLSVDHGAYVVGDSTGPAVVAGSPAAKAGLKSGDVITAVDGERVDQNDSLADIIQKKSVGQTVTLTIDRAGQELSLKATLTALP
ncbi:MAG TPA: trypsin-like peptidase domain-containing protein, partial [Candidatus Paceibacterota bacterium]|nr:trypsin-like peptidase domain-containing protein [Candidatus Paceibacterota bacterium]